MKNNTNAEALPSVKLNEPNSYAKIDLVWIFVASSIVNLMMLTCVYMLQILTEFL